MNKQNETILGNLPLNTDRAYVMAKTPDGCEVYAPIKASDDGEAKRDQLERELRGEE